MRWKNGHEWIRMIKRKVFPVLAGHAWGHFGKDSIIDRPIFISGKKNIYIGSHVQIREHARIEAISDYHGRVLKPRLVIGSRTSIEERVHITCADLVEIGEKVTVSSDVLITDSAHSLNPAGRCVLDNELHVAQTSIGECSFIGAGAKILAGVHLGKNVVIGANAVVTKDVPAYSMAAGVPAKVIKTYDHETNIWTDRDGKENEK